MIILKSVQESSHRVSKGETLSSICEGAEVSVSAVISLNRLTKEVEEGRILNFPPRGNSYTVLAGDSPEKLCSSKEKFVLLNGNDKIFIGQRVRI